ncbi:MAG TPA: LPD29 domain-containing protein [Solirubrobacteraceae bacterium]|nr:LPD29 domain-containing protein [Solirubrobacteraceae bacterium]
MSAATVETIDETCTQTAARIRKALKAQYRAVKFSVRSKTYSGGSSITVYWTDGPAERAVWAFLQKFSGADFDGMTDMKSYRGETLFANADGTFSCINSGADFVFASRTISQEWREEVAREIERVSGEPCDLTNWGDDGGKVNGAGWSTRYALTVVDDELVRYAGLEYGADLLRQATRRAR